MNAAVYGPDRQEGGAPGTLERLATQIDNAETALADLETNAGELATRLGSMQDQSDRAADELCALVEAQTITDDQAKPALAYLVGESCDGDPLDPPDTDGAGGPDFPAGLSERLTEGSEDMAYLKALTESAGDARDSLDTIGNGVDGVYTSLKEALDQRYGGADDGITFSVLIDQLLQLSEDLNAQNAPLAAALDRLEEDTDDVAEINSQIDKKVADAKKLLTEMLDQQTDDVSAAGTDASEELGTMLERSSQGLSNAAGKVVTNGRKSLEEQKRQFAAAQQQASNRISSTIEKGLGPDQLGRQLLDP